MRFGRKRKNRKAQQHQARQNQQLAATIKEVYRKHQLFQELEQSAYEVPEELYMMRKIEGAKYRYLMKVARERNLTGDVATPLQAKNHWLQKRGYQKDNLFIDED